MKNAEIKKHNPHIHKSLQLLWPKMQFISTRFSIETKPERDWGNVKLIFTEKFVPRWRRATSSSVPHWTNRPVKSPIIEAIQTTTMSWTCRISSWTSIPSTLSYRSAIKDEVTFSKWLWRIHRGSTDLGNRDRKSSCFISESMKMRAACGHASIDESLCALH